MRVDVLLCFYNTRAIKASRSRNDAMPSLCQHQMQFNYSCFGFKLVSISTKLRTKELGSIIDNTLYCTYTYTSHLLGSFLLWRSGAKAEESKRVGAQDSGEGVNRHAIRGAKHLKHLTRKQAVIRNSD